MTLSAKSLRLLKALPALMALISVLAWVLPLGQIAPTRLSALLVAIVSLTALVYLSISPGPTHRFAMFEMRPNHIVKASLCGVAGLVWVALAVRLVPDTNVGVAILMAPFAVAIVFLGVHLLKSWSISSGARQK